VASKMRKKNSEKKKPKLIVNTRPILDLNSLTKDKFDKIRQKFIHDGTFQI
jgi:hypothetical protein